MITTLGPPPTDTRLKVERGELDISENNAWTNWLQLIFGILLNMGPTLRKVVDVNFPPCPPQSSIDVNVPFPGVRPAINSGDLAPVVSLGLSSNTQYTTNNGFYAYVSAVDVVTIREFCVDPFGIGGFTDTVTIMVSLGEPGVQ